MSRVLGKILIKCLSSDYSVAKNFHLFNDTLFPNSLRPTGRLSTPEKSQNEIRTWYNRNWLSFQEKEEKKRNSVSVGRSASWLNY